VRGWKERGRTNGSASRRGKGELKETKSRQKALAARGKKEIGKKGKKARKARGQQSKLPKEQKKRTKACGG